VESLLENLLANFIWALVGVIGVLLYRAVFVILPTNRLWRLRNAPTLMICTATTRILEHTTNQQRDWESLEH
jgi:hypothetical protein